MAPLVLLELERWWQVARASIEGDELSNADWFRVTGMIEKALLDAAAKRSSHRRYSASSSRNRFMSEYFRDSNRKIGRDGFLDAIFELACVFRPRYNDPASYGKFLAKLVCVRLSSEAPQAWFCMHYC